MQAKQLFLISGQIWCAHLIRRFWYWSKFSDHVVVHSSNLALASELQKKESTWYFLMSASLTERLAYFIASSKWALVMQGTGSTSSSITSGLSICCFSLSISLSMFSLHIQTCFSQWYPCGRVSHCFLRHTLWDWDSSPDRMFQRSFLTPLKNISAHFQQNDNLF